VSSEPTEALLHEHQAGKPVTLTQLVEIMRRLRNPETGCEWDSVQTFATIAPYTIEEAYEVADAIARDDMDALADELGDLQLQVVFHACMAEEAGHFSLEHVIDRICAKMERRHPHIFGDAAEGGHHLWEIIKAEERAERHPVLRVRDVKRVNGRKEEVVERDRRGEGSNDPGGETTRRRAEQNHQEQEKAGRRRIRADESGPRSRQGDRDEREQDRQPAAEAIHLFILRPRGPKRS